MVTREKRGIFLITGVMASGKSTVAQLLAEKFNQGVHVRGDTFRRMIVSGREEMLPDAGEEAMRQLRLRYQLAAQAADTYFEADFNVVLQDVILGPMLEEMMESIRNRPLYVIVLTPSQDAIAKREAARPKKGYGLWTISELDRQLREETPKLGMWLDTTNFTPVETVEQIWQSAWTKARV
ncbi:AAA family ATPase [Brevibacillus sp. SIMBA_040]|uniref:AAA family ATPase n=1 Tax=unclassified Brevibacillus TaxID=2684853 RepID=UPI00397E6FD1